MLVEDRTKAHADHVGEGTDRLTTAAVGLLKAIHCGQKWVLCLLRLFCTEFVSVE